MDYLFAVLVVFAIVMLVGVIENNAKRLAVPLERIATVLERERDPVATILTTLERMKTEAEVARRRAADLLAVLPLNTRPTVQ